MKKLSIVPVLALMFALTACGTTINLDASNMMKGIHRNDITPIVLNATQESSADKTAEITDFSLAIFNHFDMSENTLISPLSIISALSMTANGAENETLAQIEAVLGADVKSLNDFLYAYKERLPTNEKYKVLLANSIWFRDEPTLSVNSEFLQKNKDHYEAEIYKAPFDNTTKKDINTWITQKTDGQIEKLLEEAPSPDTVMYLINALSFDAEWETIHSKQC